MTAAQSPRVRRRRGGEDSRRAAACLRLSPMERAALETWASARGLRVGEALRELVLAALEDRRPQGKAPPV